MQDPANPSAEVVIRRFDEQHNKYKFMEANLAQKKKRQVLTLPPPPPHVVTCAETIALVM